MSKIIPFSQLARAQHLNFLEHKRREYQEREDYLARLRRLLFQMSGKVAGLFFITGILSLAANIARFAALSLAPASIVAPLVLTYPILLLFFSFLLNRKIEIFNRVVVFGTITVVAGGLLLI